MEMDPLPGPLSTSRFLPPMHTHQLTMKMTSALVFLLFLKPLTFIGSSLAWYCC